MTVRQRQLWAGLLGEADTEALQNRARLSRRKKKNSEAWPISVSGY